MRARSGRSSSRAERAKAAVFQDAQELGLEVDRHLGDLVEQHRAAARQLELAARAPLGAREGAALVAEDERLDERPGQRRAVDRHEGLVAPRAHLVERARHELLARAGVAANEHRGVRVCDATDHVANDLHRARQADDGREAPRPIDPLAQPLDLAAEREPLAKRLHDRQEHLRAQLVLEHVVLRAVAHRLADLGELDERRHHDRGTEDPVDRSLRRNRARRGRARRARGGCRAAGGRVALFG